MSDSDPVLTALRQQVQAAALHCSVGFWPWPRLWRLSLSTLPCTASRRAPAPRGAPPEENRPMSPDLCSGRTGVVRRRDEVPNLSAMTMTAGG